jgi:hypothetical protein
MEPPALSRTQEARQPMDWHPWLMFLHVGGLIVFVLGHGVSVMVAFRLRSERDPARIAALLGLSGGSVTLAYAGLLLLLGSGITAGFSGGLWGHLWIWISIVLLVLVMGAMYPLGSAHYNKVRHAVGMKGSQDRPGTAAPAAASAAELDALLSGPQPWLLTVIGGGGLLVILWLMLMHPF